VASARRALDTRRTAQVNSGPTRTRDQAPTPVLRQSQHAAIPARVMMNRVDACPSCGAAVAGGAEGCQRLFDELSVRLTSSGNLPYTVRRLAVDCYCLQHPDSYCVSAKSLAAHLTGLCWAMEFEGGEPGLKALQAWLNGRVPLVKPAIPSSRGLLTVRDVFDEQDSLGLAVARWAHATWAAYADLHPITRRWVMEAARRG